MVDNGNEPSKLSFPASYLVNQITLSLPGSGTEGKRDRRAPPQVQLVLSLEQLYNSVMENRGLWAAGKQLGVTIWAWNTEDSLPGSSVMLLVSLTQILGICLPKTSPSSRVVKKIVLQVLWIFRKPCSLDPWWRPSWALTLYQLTAAGENPPVSALVPALMLSEGTGSDAPH